MSLSNMPAGGVLVAIDGPSGTGKSSVSRELATRLDARYLDTGAMYRVATLHVLRRDIDPHDTDSVVEATANLPLAINDDPASSGVLLGGEDVSREIREAPVTRAVSAVAAIPEVRENLIRIQRTLAASAGRCVVEGRDIGTVVLADAPLKVFLTASPEIRARRRWRQDQASGRGARFEDVLADVERRDHADSTRATSPLVPADDAIVVDTSDKGFDDVVEELMNLVRCSCSAYQERAGAND